MESKQMTRKEWRKFADDLVGKILYHLDHLCYREYPLAGYDPLDCYVSYIGRELGEIAEVLSGGDDEFIDITERDLELLAEMPDDIYEEYNKILQEAIEEEAEHLHKAYCEEIRKELNEAIKENDEYWINYLKERLDDLGCELP